MLAEPLPPRARPRDVAALVVVVVAIAIAGVGIDRVTGNQTVAAAPVAAAPSDFGPSAAPAEIRDDFARPDAHSLGRAPTGQEWHTVRGSWTIRGGGASGTGVAALVVADLGSPDGSVGATAAVVAPGMSLVVRATGPQNYWSVLVDPVSKRWDLLLGSSRGLVSLKAVTTRPARDGDVVKVVLDGAVLSASVNDGRAVRVSDPSEPRGTRVGFAGLSAAGGGVWRDFVASPAASPATAPQPPANGFAP